MICSKGTKGKGEMSWDGDKTYTVVKKEKKY